jgi:TetR/AcrR family transcriptional regulator
MAEATAEAASSRREQRRLRHQDLSRAQFLDAAEEVFGRKGFHDTTLKEIAELAEFSVGSVYSFFDSKDDLFRQIFVRRGEQFMPQLRGVLRREDQSPVEQLDQLVDFEVGFFRAHPHFGRLFLRNSSAVLLSADRDVDLAMVGNYDESMELQAGLFRRGQAAGVFRAGDPEVLARLFSGIMSSYQAVDPAVVSDAETVTERMPLEDLKALVRDAFVLPAAR